MIFLNFTENPENRAVTDQTKLLPTIQKIRSINQQNHSITNANRVITVRSIQFEFSSNFKFDQINFKRILVKFQTVITITTIFQLPPDLNFCIPNGFVNPNQNSVEMGEEIDSLKSHKWAKSRQL